MVVELLVRSGSKVDEETVAVEEIWSAGEEATSMMLSTMVLPPGGKGREILQIGVGPSPQFPSGTYPGVAVRSGSRAIAISMSRAVLGPWLMTVRRYWLHPPPTRGAVPTAPVISRSASGASVGLSVDVLLPSTGSKMDEAMVVVKV